MLGARLTSGGSRRRAARPGERGNGGRCPPKLSRRFRQLGLLLVLDRLRYKPHCRSQE